MSLISPVMYVTYTNGILYSQNGTCFRYEDIIRYHNQGIGMVGVACLAGVAIISTNLRNFHRTCLL